MIVIIDYGMGNLKNVYNALKYLNIHLHPLTTHLNSSQCFFCASLSQLLLAAVLINISLHSLHGRLPMMKAQNIPLFIGATEISVVESEVGAAIAIQVAKWQRQ